MLLGFKDGEDLTKIGSDTHLAGGVALFEVSEALSAGFTDISSIKNWAEHGPKLIGDFYGFRDWKKLRSEIKSIVNTLIGFSVWADWGTMDQADKDAATVNWNDVTKFSAEDQSIASHYFTAPLDLQKTIVNSDAYWVGKGVTIFQKNSVESRKARLAFMVSEVRTRMNALDSRNIQRELRQIAEGTEVIIGAGNKLIGKVQGLNLIGSYISEGIEGSTEDNDAESIGMNDFLEGRVGTPFNNKGLAQKGFIAIGMADDSPGGTTPMEKMRDRLQDIINNGNY